MSSGNFESIFLPQVLDVVQDVSELRVQLAMVVPSLIGKRMVLIACAGFLFEFNLGLLEVDAFCWVKLLDEMLYSVHLSAFSAAANALAVVCQQTIDEEIPELVMKIVQQWVDGEYLGRIVPLIPLLGICYGRVGDEWQGKIMFWFKQLIDLGCDEISIAAARTGIVLMPSVQKVSHLMTLACEGLILAESGSSPYLRYLGRTLMRAL